MVLLSGQKFSLRLVFKIAARNSSHEYARLVSHEFGRLVVIEFLDDSVY